MFFSFDFSGFLGRGLAGYFVHFQGASLKVRESGGIGESERRSETLFQAFLRQEPDCLVSLALCELNTVLKDFLSFLKYMDFFW